MNTKIKRKLKAKITSKRPASAMIFDPMAMLEKDTGTHYRFMYKGIKLDPARVMAIYGGPKHPLQMAILKKILCVGDRGHNNVRDDIEDIITAGKRWLEMMDEDEADESN